LSTRGMIAVLVGAAAAATITSRCCACCMVLIGLVCQVAQTFCSLPMEPIQLSLAGCAE
jgi:hypothetical protein